jgi:hypothetical protein
VTTIQTTAGRTIEDAARRLYDAEVAFHAARATRVDSWIAVAADRLHEAVVAHLSAVIQAGGAD